MVEQSKSQINKNRRYNKHKLSNTKFDERCLIFTDLDGTLLDKTCVIKPYSIKVIKKLTKMGHIFCICTARPRRSSQVFYKLLNLKTPLVNYNGSRIFNPTDPNFDQICYFINTEVIYKIFSNKQVSKMVENVLLETPDGTFFLKPIDKKYSKKDLVESLKQFNVFTTKDIHFVSNDFTQLRSGAFSILVALKNSKDAVKFSRLVRKTCSSVIVRSWTEEHIGVVIEINSIFPSKGLALRFLSAYYDVPLSRCYAFGDNENDVEMLMAAKNSYAMKNGSAFAIQAASHVTKYNNDEEGEARTLNEIFKLGIEYQPKHPLSMFEPIKKEKN